MVQSVERALTLLSEASRNPGGLADLAERSGLAMSTASRLLSTLEAGGAVSRDERGIYGVGPAIEAMNPSLAGASLQALAHPHLGALATALDEAVCLSVPLNHETLTLVQVDVPRPVQAEDWTGNRWPLTAGGSGLVMMATWSDERVAAALDGAQRPTDLRGVREAGVAWTSGGYVEGLTSVAAAVVSPDDVGRAAVVAYGPSYRFPAKGARAEIEEQVRACADVISAELAESWATRGARS